MMFEKRTKKAIRIIWIGVSVLIIVSMLLYFAPGLLIS